MPRLIRAVLLDEKLIHTELHVIEVPDFKDQGFYRQTLSYSAFFKPAGVKRGSPTFRRNNPPHACWYYGILFDQDWDIQLKGQQLLKEQFPDLVMDSELPTFEHKGIWAFYEHIGYDYKCNKWADARPSQP